MRIPRITKIDKSVEEQTIKIDDVEKLDFPYIDRVDVNDKLIKRIEKIIRTSFEYREYIQFLKEELDLNYCSFFSNVNWDDITIEMHHSLFTLYDITAIVLNKQLINNTKVTVWDVAEEVMYIHYKNIIALTPLSKTVHDLVHTGDVFIPLQMQYGDWITFWKEYKTYMTSDQLSHMKRIVKASNDCVKDFQTPSILERKYTYIECEGFTLPRKIEIEEKVSL